jgi:hypothetical protein
MRQISFFLLLSVFASHVAAELPVISVKEGRNEISFRISNKSAGYIEGLKIEVEKEKLPSWLEVRSSKETISVPGNESGSGKVTLLLDVRNGPNSTSAEVPVYFTDGSDNRWNYTFKAVVNSGESSEIRYRDTLEENYPNPFNPTTTIRYSLSETRNTTLAIYNSIGQKIRTLVNQPQNAGFHVVQWDGCDERGNKVSSGLYIYKLVSGKFIQSKQMILVE